MDNTASRAARLQAIKDRWFTEPLAAQFPAQADDGASHSPRTCDEFVRSDRISAAFSSLHEAPEAAGMTPEIALAQDRELNARRFRVEDPKAMMVDLSRQFDLAPTGRIDPEPLKKGFVVLDTFRADSIELATASAPPLQESYVADGRAAEQAQGLVAALASELGVSLPVSRGVGRRK